MKRDFMKRDESKRGMSIFKEALKIFNYLPSAGHALRGRAS